MEPLEMLLLAGVVLVVAFLAYSLGRSLANREWTGKVASIRQDAVSRSRAVLGGQFSEQLAPYLPDFPYSPTEARFIGKPIDLIVFKGADAQSIQEVIFVEIKSGEARLSSQERQLRDAIQNNRVSWVEYRIPKELTRAKKES